MTLGEVEGSDRIAPDDHEQRGKQFLEAYGYSKDACQISRISTSTNGTCCLSSRLLLAQTCGNIRYGLQ